ncbi:MAG: hypothetical protein GX894_02870 [Clostridia bacterium]|nr:hypothetical protein [Clostridia bacterium]
MKSLGDEALGAGKKYTEVFANSLLPKIASQDIIDLTIYYKSLVKEPFDPNHTVFLYPPAYEMRRINHLRLGITL